MARSCLSLDRVRRRAPWAAVTATLAFAVVILAVLMLVLLAFNGRAVGDWHFPMTLNTSVALLSTLLWMATAVPLSMCLSQLKWNHFHTSSSGDGGGGGSGGANGGANGDARSLIDFQHIDYASRGFAGSLLLFGRKMSQVGRMLLPMTAALLTILGTAISPLVQQILDIAIVQTEAFGMDSARLLVGDSRFDWNPPDAQYLNNNSTLAVNMTQPLIDVYALTASENATSALYNGLFSGADADFSVPGDCSGGVNCTWAFSQLAFQGSCSNISHLLNTNASQVASEWQQIDQKTRSIYNLSQFLTSQYHPDSQKRDEPLNSSMVTQDLLASTLITGLPNGFNFSLLDAYSTYLQNMNLSSAHEVAALVQQSIYTGAGSTRHTMVSSMSHEPILASVQSGTLLLLHIIYVETEFGGTFGNYSQFFSIGKTAAYECTIDLVAQYRTANTMASKYSEAADPDRAAVQSDDVPIGTICAREQAIKVTETTCTPAEQEDACAVVTKNTSLEYFVESSCNDPNTPYLNFSEPRISSAGFDMAVDPLSAIGIARTLNAMFSGNATGPAWADGRAPLGDGATIQETAAVWGSFDNGFGAIASSETTMALSKAVASDVQRNESLRSSALTPDSLLANTADSLTRYLRQTGGTYAPGTAFNTQVVYHVNWGWFAIPATLVVMTIAVATATILDTRAKRLPVWTDSALAVMTHGISGSGFEGGAVNNDLGDEVYGVATAAPSAHALYGQRNAIVLHRLAAGIQARLEGRDGVLRVVPGRIDGRDLKEDEDDEQESGQDQGTGGAISKLPSWRGIPSSLSPSREQDYRYSKVHGQGLRRKTIQSSLESTGSMSESSQSLLSPPPPTQGRDSFRKNNV